MATTQTTTATDLELTLTPPDPVPTVAPEKAAGLVPVADEVRSKLDAESGDKIYHDVQELVRRNGGV